MNITKVYKDGENIKHVQIDDEGLEYPILVSSLHKPAILDNLLQNGWELFGLPFDLRKDGVRLQAVESEVKTWHDFTTEEQQDMLDINTGLYDDVDLRSKITSRAVAATYQLYKSVDVIKTNEEFKSFLTDLDSNVIDPMDFRAYLPINSFVAREALFTIEEFTSPENANFRRIIREHRELSIEQFKALTQYLIDNKILVENYSPKALADAYMKWGVPGINLQFRDFRQEDNPYLLGVSPRINSAVLPYVYDRDIALLDHNGNVIYPKGKEYYDVDISADLRSQVLMGLSSKSFNIKPGNRAVSPVEIRTRVNNEVGKFYGEIEVTYNEGQILIQSMSTGNLMYPLIEVTIDGAEGGRIPPDNLDFLHNERVYEDIFNRQYITAIVDEIVERKTVRTNISTRSALECVSVSPGAAIRYLMNHPDADEILTGPNPEDPTKFVRRNAIDCIQDARAYLYGEAEAQDIHPGVREVVDAYLNGTFNTDSIAVAIQADATSNKGHILNAISAANKLMGMSLDSIYQQVLNIDIETEELVLENNGMTLSLILNRRDNTIPAYRADIDLYSRRQASESNSLHYITTAYREMGFNDRNGNDPLRHVAVETLTFNKFGGGKKTWQMAVQWIKSELQLVVPASQLYMFETAYDMFAARALFSLHQRGSFTLKVGAMSKEITHPWLEAQAKKLIVSRFESILALTEESIHSDGKFQSAIVNAAIIDDVVIPHNNNTITEKSIYYYWTPLAPMDPLRNKLYEAGHIPRPDWEGAKLLYNWTDPADYDSRLAVLGYGSTNTEMINNPVSLGAYMSYYEEWKNQFPSSAYPVSPPPYRYNVFPHIYQEEMEEYMSSAFSKPNPEGKTYKTFVEPKREGITQEQMLEKYPTYAKYYNPTVLGRGLRDGEPARKFFGLSAEDIFFLKDREVIQNATKFAGKPFVYYYGSDTISYLGSNGQVLTGEIRDLARLAEEGTYAVKHLYGRRYLFQDVRGAIYETEI